MSTQFFVDLCVSLSYVTYFHRFDHHFLCCTIWAPRKTDLFNLASLSARKDFEFSPISTDIRQLRLKIRVLCDDSEMTCGAALFTVFVKV